MGVSMFLLIIDPMLHQNLGVSPDEKFFTPTDERGFLPYTPHPTPSFKSGDR
ncbi:unknown protein [Microcystis aeruginosa NIES-843]|uniref:Uncharacterized protein n=3 Tax=Microcystis aeruginosa TaxID=1126 RepID=B0JG25_MICAN|nr:unknown protein [Microcystis aeruginosa NIES-843]